MPLHSQPTRVEDKGAVRKNDREQNNTEFQASTQLKITCELTTQIIPSFKAHA